MRPYGETFLERMRLEPREPILLLFRFKVVIEFGYRISHAKVSVLPKLAEILELINNVFIHLEFPRYLVPSHLLRPEDSRFPEPQWTRRT